jgi:hypothetical protein
MIKVENIEIFNFDGAMRGLRNPMNSWDKSDSYTDEIGIFNIGSNDMKLAQRMLNGGPEESKFMRQIMISMDIDAPIFWWKEMDTYKVGTTANSCSTMHKLTSEEISAQNFSFIKPEEFEDQYNQYFIKTAQEEIIQYCEILRKAYNKTKDKRIWRALIEILPEGWNQRRTWTANYQVLRNIYFQRRFHKLDEWREFCKIIEGLPYGKELICYEKAKKE